MSLPVIAVYQNMSSDGDLEYWLYESLGVASYRRSQFYDDSKMTQIQYFSAAPGGIVLDQLKLFYGLTDSEYIDAEIRSDDLFSASAKDSNMVLIQHLVLWESSDSSIFTEVTQNHRFMGIYQDANSDSILTVQTTDMIEHYDNGYITSKGLMWKYFEKDRGLVASQKYRDGELVSDLRLIDLRPLDSFIERYGFAVPVNDLK